MLHRLFILLLIGTTLSGSSLCCCALRGIVEPADVAKCCCCQDAASSDSGSGKSEENDHRCPCRQQHAVGARLENGMLALNGSAEQYSMLLCAYRETLHWGSVVDTFSSSHGLPDDWNGLETAGIRLLVALCVCRC